MVADIKDKTKVEKEPDGTINVITILSDAYIDSAITDKNWDALGYILKALRP